MSADTEHSVNKREEEGEAVEYPKRMDAVDAEVLDLKGEDAGPGLKSDEEEEGLSHIETDEFNPGLGESPKDGENADQADVVADLEIGDNETYVKELDPLLESESLKPLLERRDRSLKELLEAMDTYAPIIPDAVTDFYVAKAGFKTNDRRVKRLLALATQKFVSDIATDAYQFARIRSHSGNPSTNPSRGRAAGGQGRTVLGIDDLSNVLIDYGINVRRPNFYR